jgi:hypothetical protein
MAQRSLWRVGDGPANLGPIGAVIQWSCRKDTHRAAPSRGGRGGLTCHQGRWAYCDGAVEDDQHDWVPTGGVPIDRLVDWTKAMDPYRATTIRR